MIFNEAALLDELSLSANLYWGGLICIHFSWGKPEVYMDLGEWEGVLLRVKFHWLELKILGMPYLYGETFQESQVLAEQVLILEKRKAVGLPRTT